MDLPWVPLEGGWQQSRPPGTCGPLSISLLQVRPERIPTKRSHSLRGDSWPFVRQAGAGVGLGPPGRAGHVGFPGGLWCQQQGSKGAPGRAPHGIGAPTGLRLSRSPAAPDQLHLPSPPKRKHDLLWRPPPPPRPVTGQAGWTRADDAARRAARWGGALPLPAAQRQAAGCTAHAPRPLPTARCPS